MGAQHVQHAINQNKQNQMECGEHNHEGAGVPPASFGSLGPAPEMTLCISDGSCRFELLANVAIRLRSRKGQLLSLRYHFGRCVGRVLFVFHCRGFRPDRRGKLEAVEPVSSTSL